MTLLDFYFASDNIRATIIVIRDGIDKAVAINTLLSNIWLDSTTFELYGKWRVVRISYKSITLYKGAPATQVTLTLKEI